MVTAVSQVDHSNERILLDGEKEENRRVALLQQPSHVLQQAISAFIPLHPLERLDPQPVALRPVVDSQTEDVDDSRQEGHEQAALDDAEVVDDEGIEGVIEDVTGELEGCYSDCQVGDSPPPGEGLGADAFLYFHDGLQF